MSRKQVVIGSKNQAKIQAVVSVFEEQDIDIVSLETDSGVSDQPFSDEETIEGAINRAKYSLKKSTADLGIGLEGGVVETKHGLFLCNWGAMVTKQSDLFIAGGARIPLPEAVAKELRQGKELGPIMDEFTKKAGIRKKEGAIGVFTNEKINRADMFTHIVKMLIGQYEYQIKAK
jgi:inosine/xanthosine triphosphatase